MRRRRRKGPAGDSLELLLDTICNTFGGIVFIALLIVLLLRQTAVVTAEPADTTTPAELERLVGELAETTAELASLRTARADLALRAEAFAPNQVRDLLNERNALVAKVAALQSGIEQQRIANATSAAVLERRRADLQSAVAEAAEAAKTLAELDRELKKVRAAKSEEIRNPLVRESTTFRSVGIIVRYGRMYLWHNYDSSGNRLGLNKDDFVVTGENKGGLVTHPDPTRGLPLSDDAAAVAAIRSTLRQFTPGRFYITAVVRPDSFAEFEVLRDVLIGSGFHYRLMPSDGAIVDRGGSDSRVQ